LKGEGSESIEEERGGFNIHKKATPTENARWRKMSKYNLFNVENV